MAGKGTDEVVSIVYKYFAEKLSDKIEVLGICSDGTASQAWNNIFMLFLKQIADSNSIYHNVLPNLKCLTLH